MTQQVFDIKFEGLEVLQREIARLGPKVGQRAWSRTIDTGTQKIVNAVKTAVRQTSKEPTGRLEKAIVKRRTRKYEPFFWKGSVAVNRGATRDDPAGAYYWLMVDVGHRIAGWGAKVTRRTHIGGKNYIQQGVMRVRDGVIGEMVGKAKTELDREWANIAKNMKVK